MKSLTTDLIIAELEKRGQPYKIIPTKIKADYIIFKDATGRTRYVRGTVTDKSNAMAYRIAEDKLVTGMIAEAVGVPVPKTSLYSTPAEAEQFLKNYPSIVVKPLDAAHGNGVTVDIKTAEQLHAAIKRAQAFSEDVLLQQQVSGRDLRLLYIGGEFCAAAERTPASVVGDGRQTLRQLIEQTNAQPDRGQNYEKKYNVIPLDVAALYLGEQIDNLVPQAGEVVSVVGTANIGTGGTAKDVTDELSPRLIKYGERLVKELGVGVYGVDFLEGADGAFLIEINASPSFGLHQYPHIGTSRDVAKVFVDWLLRH